MLLDSDLVAHMINGLNHVNRKEALNGMRVLLFQKRDEAYGIIGCDPTLTSIEKMEKMRHWLTIYETAIANAERILCESETS